MLTQSLQFKYSYLSTLRFINDFFLAFGDPNRKTVTQCVKCSQWQWLFKQRP